MFISTKDGRYINYERIDMFEVKWAYDRVGAHLYIVAMLDGDVYVIEEYAIDDALDDAIETYCTYAEDKKIADEYKWGFNPIANLRSARDVLCHPELPIIFEDEKEAFVEAVLKAEIAAKKILDTIIINCNGRAQTRTTE